jgi:peptide/nickel transport system ATP-binding protein
VTLLALENVSVTYGVGGRALRAVRGVSLAFDRGETVGLVGESGCGKSTLARAIVGLLPVAGGRVLLDGESVTGRKGRRRNEVTRRVQLVFQDPYSSLNPRMSVRETLTEAMLAHRSVNRSEREAELARLMDLVALSATALDRHPHEFSGGQRQRIAIARALAVESDVLIADEITSALDVSVQASILNLLRDIQREVGVACLFISHDLSVVRYVSARVAVMHLGRIVEQAPSPQLFASPRHPYTRVLLDSLPALARAGANDPLRALREPADPHAPPAGCDFHQRCPLGPAADPSRRICTDVDPQTLAAENPHATACHFPIDTAAPAERSRRPARPM